jgi:NAD(P)-dependent dehydrogenase (short-subunit alcohol dehydrogenase family)
VPEYGPDALTAAFSSIHARYPSPEYAVTVAIFNVGHGVWKPFLQVTPEDVRESNKVNIEGSFAFAREAILAFQKNEPTPATGAKGTLVFTGATASLRGNVVTSVFASGKFALRALTQSLAKEFGKQDIHVRRAPVSVSSLSDRSRA